MMPYALRRSVQWQDLFAQTNHLSRSLQKMKSKDLWTNDIFPSEERLGLMNNSSKCYMHGTRTRSSIKYFYFLSLL